VRISTKGTGKIGMVKRARMDDGGTPQRTEVRLVLTRMEARSGPLQDRVLLRAMNKRSHGCSTVRQRFTVGTRIFRQLNRTKNMYLLSCLLSVSSNRLRFMTLITLCSLVRI